MIKHQIYHYETPNEDKVKSFSFSISNSEKGASSDGRLLVCPFHKLKHLPPNCPSSMSTFLRLPPTRLCLIFRECRSLAIMPLGWVASCLPDVAAGRYSASFLPPLPFEEGVRSLALCYTSLSHSNSNMLWIREIFYFTYFWMRWVFIALNSFSLVAASRSYSS